MTGKSLGDLIGKKKTEDTPKKETVITKPLHPESIEKDEGLTPKKKSAKLKKRGPKPSNKTTLQFRGDNASIDELTKLVNHANSKGFGLDQNEALALMLKSVSSLSKKEFIELVMRMRTINIDD